MTETVTTRERDVLRRLAERKARIADDPLNLERRRLWYALDGGTGGRPMVLAEVQGIQDDVRALDDRDLLCRSSLGRRLESTLRREIYEFDVLRDDHVIEPWINTRWHVSVSDYGVRSVQHRPDNAGHLGARRWDPPIRDLDADFETLRPRRYAVDREASLAEKQVVEDLLAGILPARIRQAFWWTTGMTIVAIDLIGLEPLMLAMFDNPAGLHRLMAFLRDDHLAFARWLEAEGLLCLNNENDYIGSGSMGYTRDLPPAGRRPGDPVRMKDLWVLSESQETVGVGPDQFAEFVFPYQHAVVREFGKCYYGCCEPVHSRWHVLKRLPNLARVSVSPWADEAFMAASAGREVVYSRKPNPSLISTAVFNQDAIRADLRRTLEIARGCRVELIMKDVHTLHNEPDRLPRWVALAREVIDELGLGG